MLQYIPIHSKFQSKNIQKIIQIINALISPI